MGLLMDTLEDSSEKTDQFHSSIRWAILRSSPGAGEAPRPLPSIECPLCATLWLSDQDLQDHIFAAHRKAGDVYLRLNGRIVGDLSYVEGVIDELQLSLLGADSTRFDLQLEGVAARHFDLIPGRHRELSSFIPNGFAGRIMLIVHTPFQSKSYEIHNRRVPTLDIAALDRAIDELQRPLLSAGEPPWAAWKALHIERLSDQSLERRYLAGFFEYLLGASLEQRGDGHAGGHFEQAFGYLRPFRTHLAHTARCILALKLNWFSLLGHCPHTSLFWPAHAFFNRAGWRKRHIVVGKTIPTTRQDIEGLWVDTFLEQLLEAVLRFHEGAYAETAHLVGQLWTHPFARDPNSEVKLWLLEARAFMLQDRAIEARKAYGALRHHPLYGAEAQEAFK